MEFEFEIGDEILDFASLLDLLSSPGSKLGESFAVISFFDEPCVCVIRPYNTSAISISSSSGFEEDDFNDDFGGRGLDPLSFYKIRSYVLAN